MPDMKTKAALAQLRVQPQVPEPGKKLPDYVAIHSPGDGEEVLHKFSASGGTDANPDDFRPL